MRHTGFSVTNRNWRIRMDENGQRYYAQPLRRGKFQVRKVPDDVPLTATWMPGHEPAEQ